MAYPDNILPGLQPHTDHKGKSELLPVLILHPVKGLDVVLFEFIQPHKIVFVLGPLGYLLALWSP